MNFQQLRILRETVKQQYNLTLAAEALHTSQSGLSKHIKDLEDELGVQLFVRKGKRLLCLTEAGTALMVLVERILNESQNMKRLAEDFKQVDQGELVIATTHTQARYVLPPIVTAFKQQYPQVHLVLHQASPTDIATMLKNGEIDIAIATESIASSEHFYSIPFYQWQHQIIVPNGHPLISQSSVSLLDLAQYALITYHGGFTGRSKIDDTFKQAGITPDIVMSALDADVIKTYVELNLGVGIIASIAYQPEREKNLTILEAQLFGENTTWIAARRGRLLREFAYYFIQLCRKDIDLSLLRDAANTVPSE